MMTKVNSDDDALLFPEIVLRTIHRDDGRSIAYSCTTAHASNSVPILYFYPGGGNRRMLLSIVKTLPDLRLICVNRPGKGGTSPATSSSKVNSHLDASVQDAVAVLDSLGVDKVSLLCMCAGTPFGMAFAIQHPERTTRQFMGISAWIQPADCGYENTKVMYYLGTHAPGLVSPLVGSVFRSVGLSLSSFPTTWVLSALRGKVSESEHVAFDITYKNSQEFGDRMRWMQQEQGGQSPDMKVLLSAGLIDSEKLGASMQSITLWHGTKDSMVPYASAEWMEEHVSGVTLNTIPDGSHEGCMFLLHSSIVKSLKSFGQGE
jgi:pimeloyl-ACP methyl ester carboxylesterase